MDNWEIQSAKDDAYVLMDQIKGSRECKTLETLLSYIDYLEGILGKIAEKNTPKTVVRNMSNDITDPIESLHNTIVFDVKSWSTDRRNAWIYGIIVGWHSEDKEEEENIFQEFNESFGWSRETWNRLKLLHEEFLKYKEIRKSNLKKE